MTKEEIQEGNLLIAKFMGAQLNNKWKDEPTYTYHTAPSWTACYNWCVRDMRYHEDYAWIMPVVDKIETDCSVHNEHFWFQIQYAACKVGFTNGEAFLGETGNSKIESIFLTVVAFIKWRTNTSRLDEKEYFSYLEKLQK